MINSILTSVRMEIRSFKTAHESKGTNMYPKDSRIGKSLRLTPLLIAVIFIKREPKNMAYARMTRQFSIIATIPLPFSMSALLLSNSWEQAQAKIPHTTRQ